MAVLPVSLSPRMSSRWPRPIGISASKDLDARLQGNGHGITGHHRRGLPFDGEASRRTRLSLVVERPTQGIYHPPQQSFSHRDVENPLGAAHFSACRQMLARIQEYDPDFFGVDIENKPVYFSGKADNLFRAGGRLRYGRCSHPSQRAQANRPRQEKTGQGCNKPLPFTPRHEIEARHNPAGPAEKTCRRQKDGHDDRLHYIRFPVSLCVPHHQGLHRSQLLIDLLSDQSLIRFIHDVDHVIEHEYGPIEGFHGLLPLKAGDEDRLKLGVEPHVPPHEREGIDGLRERYALTVSRLGESLGEETRRLVRILGEEQPPEMPVEIDRLMSSLLVRQIPVRGRLRIRPNGLRPLTCNIFRMMLRHID